MISVTGNVIAKWYQYHSPGATASPPNTSLQNNVPLCPTSKFMHDAYTFSWLACFELESCHLHRIDFYQILFCNKRYMHLLNQLSTGVAFVTCPTHGKGMYSTAQIHDFTIHPPLSAAPGALPCGDPSVMSE